MQLSPLQSRLAASFAASVAILILYLLLFSPGAALAAEVATFSDVATSTDIMAAGATGEGQEMIADTELDGIYEPEFGLFDRDVMGRAPPGVLVLQNNEPQVLNLQPGTSICYAFEKSVIFGSSQGNSRRDAAENGKKDSDDGNVPSSSSSSSSLPGGGSAVDSKRVYLSANTCLQPYAISPDSTTPAPPQLSMYVSKSSQTGCNPLPQNASGFQSQPFDLGAVMWSFNATGDVFITIAAPAAPAGFQGVYNYEIAVSTDDFYHRFDGAGDELLWMDSDSSSALLMTKNLTTNVFDETQILDQGPQYELYVAEKTASAVAGLLHSACGLKKAAPMASRRLENGEFNNGDTARTKLTVNGPGRWPKQQFYFDDLQPNASYTGVLFKPYNKTATAKRQASEGPGAVGGGGIIFAGTDFQTSAGTNCRVITDLEFCDEVQWAAPGNDRLNNSELAKVYDDYARRMYANFAKAMMQIPCEAPSIQQYSLARNCNDCMVVYKRWLCTVSIPRCEDLSRQGNFSIIRNAGQPFPNGTMLPDDVRSMLGQNPASNSSRNSFIDQTIAPGPYREILPCADICYEVVQSCPAALGFSCPGPHMIGFNVSYGQRQRGASGVRCNYPGEPRTRFTAAASGDGGRVWLVMAFACLTAMVLL